MRWSLAVGCLVAASCVYEPYDCAIGGERVVWFVDGDGDGFGAEPVEACEAPEGTVSLDGDCDDRESTIHPDAEEVPGDGVDSDCDGTEACFVDADGDGFGANRTVQSADRTCAEDGLSAVGGDCIDQLADVSPGEPEIACDGIDNDCSPETDDNPDVDGDGVRACWGDCDDGRPDVWEGAPEVPGDGVDQDCDGVDDCYVDADADGFGGPFAVTGDSLACPPGGESSTDCDDTDPHRNPGSAEVLCDVRDNDCDPTTPDDWDVDNDGISVCDGDCDDLDATIGECEE